jgi:RNA polymerase sigma factor (sigma-70 family)
MTNAAPTVAPPSNPTQSIPTPNELIVSHRRLVGACINSVCRSRRGFDESELTSLGNLTLVEAAHRFDPTRGVTFVTFAWGAIRGRLLDALSRGSREIAVRQEYCRDVFPLANAHVEGEQHLGAYSDHLERSLRRLPPQKRRIVEGCVSGKTMAVLSKELGISRPHVCRSYHASIAALREQLVPEQLS